MEDSLKTNYDKWHTSVHGEEDPHHLLLAPWHKNAFANYPNIAYKNVLEVGCGVGDFAIFLSNQKANVTAVDFSDSAVEMAKEKARIQNEHIRFLTADGQNLPFRDAEFEVIFSCECLEHIPDPQKALNEFFRVLKPGSNLILTTENYSNPMIIYWIMSLVRNKPFDSGGGQVQPIENFFLYWKVIRMMKKAGFKLMKLDSWHFVFMVVPGFHPHLFVKQEIQTSFFKKVFKPLARHLTFVLRKP